MNWRRKWKQITAVIAAGAMVAGSMTILPAKAEEKTRYPWYKSLYRKWRY